MRSIAFKCTDEAKAPKKIKLLVNRQSIDFADVADAVEPEVAQVLELTADQVKDGKRIPLRFVRFQSVNTLNVCGTSRIFVAGTDSCLADLRRVEPGR